LNIVAFSYQIYRRNRIALMRIEFETLVSKKYSLPWQRLNSTEQLNFVAYLSNKSCHKWSIYLSCCFAPC